MAHAGSDQGNDGDRGGLTRRGLFAAGTGGVAAAAIVGLGGSPQAAGKQAGTSAARPSGPLTEADPHAATERTRSRGLGEFVPVAGAASVRILPLDRAKFLAGGRFDLRVEASGVDPATARIDIEVVGPHGRPAAVLTGRPERTSSAEDSLEVTYRQLAYPKPGDYQIRASVQSGDLRARTEVRHEVVAAQHHDKRAKNVIFFLGDGMGQAAITSARILSKGITEGKYRGLLAMDRMEYRGQVGTSGADALATDSANSMSAYMTGHKSSVNAMGVYEGNNPDPAKHPHVETMAELLKRARGMKIGIVTTAEVQDATPAAVFAHTRRRSQYMSIMDQALNPAQMPDVLLGGGRASLLPKSVSGSRRTDERDLVREFQDKGFRYAGTRKELNAAFDGGTPEKLLGLFHTGNMNVYLDRQHIKKPEVLGKFDDQPTLMEMTEAALTVLERADKDGKGFFLMVEAASIDKMEHPLDGPRVAYDAIEFDKTIELARKWADQRGDTLIVVTADHNHSMSIVGTHDRSVGEGRSANGVYGNATYPTYKDSNGDGFPDDPNPEVQLFFGWSNHPDHHDDFQADPVFQQPALLDGSGKAVPNPKKDPAADVQTGNLPHSETNCVHTVEDVSVFASGPGSARFNAFLDNTEVFFAMMDALGLDATRTRS